MFPFESRERPRTLVPGRSHQRVSSVVATVVSQRGPSGSQWKKLHFLPKIGYRLSQGSHGGTEVSGIDWPDASTLCADGRTAGGQWATTGTLTHTSTGTCL